MRLIYLLIFGCIFISEAVAQNSLSGTIINQTNKEPLLATVYLPQLEKGTIADISGTYNIVNIPQGTYKVIYSLLGFSSISKEVTFSENESVIQHIEMEETAVEMEEVIISTPFHKLQSDNVMKVERVSMADLKSKGAFSLSDGITNIAGVNTVSTGVGIGKPIIRGLSSNRVLTYSQGVRIENQQFGDEHGLGINGSGVESIEVIKGPASLLYGSDALGGVLYINPEKFAPASTFSSDLSSDYFSNTLGSSTNLGVKASLEKFKFLARGAFVQHSDYKTGDTYRVTNTRFNEKDFKTGFRYQGSTLKSTLRYNYNRSNLGITEGIGIQSTSKELLLPHQEIDNHILSWENKLFLKSSSLEIKAGYILNDRREFEEMVIEPTLQMKLATFNYDIKYYLPVLGKFESIIGLQGMLQNNENFGEEILIPNADIRDIGLMGTTHYHLEKIDLQVGIRFDHRKIASDPARDPSEVDFINAIDKDFSSINAALGAKVNISEKITGRLNFASGFRSPNLAELASNGVHEGTNRYERGNSSLDNEQNIQVDLSLEYRNEHFEFTANGFYNSITDYIFISPTNEIVDQNLVFEYIQGDAHLYGGEFGVHIHPHPLDWLHFESSFETVTGRLKNDSYLPLIPANVLRNTIRIEINEGKTLKSNYAFASLENTFKQNKINVFENSTKGYNLLNLGAGSTLELKKLKLGLGVNITNLMNIKYYAHLSRLKRDEIYNIGRSININLKLEI